MTLLRPSRRTLSCALAAALLITGTVGAVTASARAASASTRPAAAGPSLSFPTPPPGQDGAAYSDTLTASGGVPPYAWSVSAGILPPGITLDASTGVLAGTPTTVGSYGFTVRVTDADGQTATEDTSLVTTRALALTMSAASVTFGGPVTLTAVITPGAAGAVAFSDLPSTGPKAGQSIILGTTAVSGNTATLTTALPAFGTNTVSATYLGSPANVTSAPAQVQVNAFAGEVLINEFRLSGPSGADDQYAELYNAGPAVPLAGFTLTASSGAAETIPASAPTLPTGQAYLITGAGYSLSAIAASDQSAASLGTAGLQLTAPDQAGTVTDAAGTASAQAGFFTGTPLPTLSGTPAAQYAWVRLEKAGVPVNTGSNAADFQLVSTTGGVVGGVQSALGSPAPSATGSPAQANTFLRSKLLDPARPVTATPNFLYQAGTPGLLTIRRTITNTLNATITAAQLRITSLSEVNGPPEPGVTTQPPVPSRLRVIDPATPTSQFTITGGHVITVHNLSVDPPATAAPGGGINTTLTLPLPSGGLAPGATLSFAITFAVDRHGPYWYGYNVDALSNLVTIGVGPGQTGSRRTSALPRRTRAAATYASGRGTLGG